MKADHLEFLVEEPSMEIFLASLLPRMLGTDITFRIHSHQGKSDLLQKLAARLRAYGRWIPDTHRIVVVVDRDNDDCMALKHTIEKIAADAELVSRSKNNPWNFVSRIAIEEMEAWYFGEWRSVCAAYPKLSSSTPTQAPYRDPDKIAGGTWEALERILKRSHYFTTGLRKLELAQAIGERFDFDNCASTSFNTFKVAVMEAVNG